MEDHVLDKEKQTSKQKAEPPKMYSVFVMNDDFSEGKGLGGTYTKDVAETKAQMMNEHAQSEGFPLHATVEQA